MSSPRLRTSFPEASRHRRVTARWRRRLPVLKEKITSLHSTRSLFQKVDFRWAGYDPYSFLLGLLKRAHFPLHWLSSLPSSSFLSERQTKSKGEQA